MEKIEQEKLNEKLLLFCGFKPELVRRRKTGAWVKPVKNTDLFPTIISCSPDLVTNFDNQVKWLHPRLANLPVFIFGDCQFGIQWESESGLYCGYIEAEEHFISYDKNPTIAFAQALEKYIDWEASRITPDA